MLLAEPDDSHQCDPCVCTPIGLIAVKNDCRQLAEYMPADLHSLSLVVCEVSATCLIIIEKIQSGKSIIVRILKASSCYIFEDKHLISHAYCILNDICITG